MAASNWCHIEVEEVLKVTDKAMLLQHADGQDWFPLSQVDEPEKYEAGDKNVTVSVTEWIAKERGFDVGS